MGHLRFAGFLPFFSVLATVAKEQRQVQLQLTGPVPVLSSRMLLTLCSLCRRGSFPIAGALEHLNPRSSAPDPQLATCCGACDTPWVDPVLRCCSFYHRANGSNVDDDDHDILRQTSRWRAGSSHL